MDFSTGESIVLIVFSIGVIGFYVWALLVADYPELRQQLLSCTFAHQSFVTDRTASRRSVFGPGSNSSNMLSDKPLPYWMRRIGLITAVVLLGWAVDVSGGRGIYPVEVVFSWTILVNTLHYSCGGTWVAFTTK